MKFLILSILLCLHSLSGWASENTSRDGGDFCIECANKSPQDLGTQQLNDLWSITYQAGKDIFQFNKLKGYGERCQNFADETGMGKWSTYIIDEMTPDRYPDLYNGADDLNNLCPNYSNLNDDEKELVWVVVLNSMVLLESSCNASPPPAMGPKGRAVGLLQLLKGDERGAGCNNGDGESVERTLRCGLTNLNKQLNHIKRLFTNKAHWAVLRTNIDGKYKIIQSAIEQFGLCHKN